MSGSKRALLGIAAVGIVLGGGWLLAQVPADTATPTTTGAGCSAVSLNVDGHAVFGANLDYQYHTRGQLFLNPRGMAKTGTHPSENGVVAEWVSDYASLTFNFVGYHYPWGGMNEKGLVLSTMAFPQSICSPADHRPVVDSGFWMQYILDTCATVEDVIASDALVRNITVDHYLVADRSGASAVIEYLNGEMVARTGDDLPVSVLANWYYSECFNWWRALRGSGNYSGMDGSIQRFCLAADREIEFGESDGRAAVPFVFDTLEIIRGENFSEHASQWSIVFDTRKMKVFFKTLAHQEMRWVDLNEINPYCSAGIQMMEIQEPLSGDVLPFFYDYSHQDARDHYHWFIDTYPNNASTQWTDQILRHFESFSCQPPPPPRRPAGRRVPIR